MVALEFKHDPLDQARRAAARELGVKAGQLFQPIRVAVCGRKNVPPLFETGAADGAGADRVSASDCQCCGSVKAV